MHLYISSMAIIAMIDASQQGDLLQKKGIFMLYILLHWGLFRQLQKKPCCDYLLAIRENKH